jgi:hypothetical protein
LPLATSSPNEESFRRGEEAFFVVPWPLFWSRGRRGKFVHRANKPSHRAIRWEPRARAQVKPRYFFLVVFFLVFFLAAFFAITLSPPFFI